MKKETSNHKSIIGKIRSVVQIRMPRYKRWTGSGSVQVRSDFHSIF